VLCPSCHSPHGLSLSPTFSIVMGWFGRSKRVQSGWAQGCWACGQEFIVTMSGETVTREQRAPQRMASPRLVPPKREEPPRESMVDDDFIPEPGFRP
jgi:hypothetical protein